MTITATGKTFRDSGMSSIQRNSMASGLQRWRLMLLMAPLISGCCSAGPILSDSQPNVVVFRGLGGYFPCLAEFERCLLDEGVCPTVSLPGAHAQVAERIIGARNNGRLQGPLVLMGY